MQLERLLKQTLTLPLDPRLIRRWMIDGLIIYNETNDDSLVANRYLPDFLCDPPDHLRLIPVADRNLPQFAHERPQAPPAGDAKSMIHCLAKSLRYARPCIRASSSAQCVVAGR